MELPCYIVEDAAKMVYENLSVELQEKFSPVEIIILEIEFDFLEQAEITSNPDSIVQLPVKIDDDAMKYYIIYNCTKKSIYLTFEEVQRILEAELIYLHSLRLIDEDGLAPFYN